MGISKIINTFLRLFGCKLVKLEVVKGGDNIDPLERNDIKTLEALWGDPEFRAKYLSPERQRLYEVVFDKVQSVAGYGADYRLLDVGCGPGFFPRLLKDKGFEGSISGCDFSSQAVCLSSSLIPEGRFFEQDIYDQIPEKYDLIVCMETLEHLLHPEKAILNLADSAPTLILTVPEGRQDSFRGHINLWTKESFEVLLKRVLPYKKITVQEVSKEKNLLAHVS